MCVCVCARACTRVCVCMRGSESSLSSSFSCLGASGTCFYLRKCTCSRLTLKSLRTPWVQSTLFFSMQILSSSLHKYAVLLYTNTLFFSTRILCSSLRKYSVLLYANTLYTNTLFFSTQIRCSSLHKYAVLLYANTLFFSTRILWSSLRNRLRSSMRTWTCEVEGQKQIAKMHVFVALYRAKDRRLLNFCIGNSNVLPCK